VLEDLETLRSWERGEFREKEPEADIPPASRPQQTGDLSRYALTAWAVLRNLVDPPASAAGVEPDKLQEWSLLPQLSENLRTAGYDDQIALNQALAVHALLRITPEPEDLPSLTARDFARLLVETRESAAFLDVNEYQGTLWVRKERLELLLELVEKSAGIAAVRASEAAAKARAARLASRVSELAGEIRTAAEASQYQVAGLIKELAKSSK
jgi:hypothetical protein